jgi:hypothetical protein
VFNERLGNTGRIGFDRGLQLRKLTRNVVADEIRPQAQHLTELDKCRAELRQGAP